MLLPADILRWLMLSEHHDYCCRGLHGPETDFMSKIRICQYWVCLYSMSVNNAVERVTII